MGSLGTGVLTVRLFVCLGAGLLGAFVDFVRTGTFGAVFWRSSFFHSATRSAMASALTTRWREVGGFAIGVGSTARFECAAARRAAAFVVRTTGWGFEVGSVVGAGTGFRSIGAAVPGREVEGPVRLPDGAAAELRSFARSLGKSFCEATVSRIFAEPTIIDLGRGLRAAVLSGFLATACATFIPFVLAGPTIDTGLVARSPFTLLCFVTGVPGFVSATDTGVADLVPLVW